jgi:hypothetical protein
MGANDLVTNGHYVAVIENHNNWQGSDPFTNVYSNARNAYYSLTANPTVVFDGVKKLAGGDHSISMYPSYLPIYQSRYAIRTNFGITIAGNYTGNNYNISVVVDRYGETPFANSNLVLHLALTQSNIAYNWQGQTHLEFVNRLMAPDANGTTIDLSSLTQVTVPLTMVFNSGWGGSIANHDYELVAWVQDLTTKEIVDAQKLDLASIPVGINNFNTGVPVLNVFPNPASTKTTVNFSLNETAQTKVEIYNVSGQVVKTLTDTELNYGSHTIDWDLKNNAGSVVANGIYICKIVSGNYIATTKVFVER